MITREDCIQIGEVSKTHSLQGAVVITADGSLLEQYAEKPVFLLLEGAPVPFFIAEGGITFRNHASCIVKFDYVDTLEDAERLVGAEVWMERAMLGEEETEEQDFDIFALTGFEVKDLVSGAVGEVSDVADYSGNVVLTLAIFGKEILLPLSEIYLSDIDWEHSRLEVNIPVELAELN